VTRTRIFVLTIIGYAVLPALAMLAHLVLT
jgi:hypothetical protein